MSVKKTAGNLETEQGPGAILKDYYDILGVSPTSDFVVIRAAFKAMMLKYHPDTNKSAGASDKAKELNEAFAILSDPAKRALYDRQRNLHVQEERQADQTPPPSPPPPPNTPASASTDGPNGNRQDSGEIGAKSITSKGAFALAVIALVVSLIAVMPRQQGTSNNPASDTKPSNEVQHPVTPISPIVEEPPAPSPSSNLSSDPIMSLSTLKDSDWDNIGMGCGCSFADGGSRKLIAGGGLTFFRLNGKEYSCSAPDAETLFDGPVSMSCGSASVNVTPTGNYQPGGDGHSSDARLSITASSGTLKLRGTWDCSC